MKRVRKQSGQALVYGLFMLMAGIAALFFLFNVGQLTREKTKLVNTSDAVAYSAGVMHARSMNFAAYTNRAMVADEIAISQSVSLASWGNYLEEHGLSAMALGCNPENAYQSEPAAELMIRYALICAVLGGAQHASTLSSLSQAIQIAGAAIVVAADVSKVALQASQGAMALTLKQARQDVMQEVADANYAGDGVVQVEELAIPLLDTFSFFDGGLPIARTYVGNDRTRMRDFEVSVVNKDGFTTSRTWSDKARLPSCVLQSANYNEADRNGGTQLIGFDEWRATDRANYYRWHYVSHRFGPTTCEESSQSLADQSQTANANGTVSGNTGNPNWPYSGVPSYLELSVAALANPDPRAQFAVRVLRENTETRTSDARADIKSTPRLNAYVSGVKQDTLSGKKVYVGLAASETFFKRPNERGDGSQELASLFNPYWQTHLMEVPASVRTAAQAAQGAVTP